MLFLTSIKKKTNQIQIKTNKTWFLLKPHYKTFSFDSKEIYLILL